MAERIPSDGVLVKNARLAVKAELQKKRALNLPITRFDPKTKEFYRLNEDGTTTIVGELVPQKSQGERRD